MSAHVLAKQSVVEPSKTEQTETTLLDLVMAVADAADTDEEIVATIASMLRSGQVMLVGNFLADSVDQKPY